MKPLIVLNSHPIQYFVPLYQEAVRQGLPLEVWYCSSYGLKGETDLEFNTRVKWDLPMLEGYSYRFLKNASPRPSIYGFWGLLNLEVLFLLFRQPPSVVLVHGWGYATHWLCIMMARLAGHTVCLRGEAPLCHENGRQGLKAALRKHALRFLFDKVHFFLYIGQENRAFYRHHGIPEERLLFAPYAVDNGRFHRAYEELRTQREALRRELGLPPDKRIVLYSGKYILKKRPLDLLAAFAACPHRASACLVFMGEGPLRPEMEAFIEREGLDNVVLTGFVNQSAVSKYYAAADLFVMCSAEGETWGLSTNEAMNFHLPVLLSDLTGSHADLVRESENGFVFPTGDVKALQEYLTRLLSLPEEELRAMGEASARIVRMYSYEEIIAALRKVAG